MNDKDKEKFKFSSSFLKKPFTPINNEEQSQNEELIQENLEIENETPSKTISKINNEITYSISDHRPQTSGFSESNINNLPNNLTISTSTMNNKKRKPFENLTFYSEKKNINYNESNINDINSNTNISNINKDKEDNESEMSDIQFKNLNALRESQTDYNISEITENEKSMIMSSYKLISRDTIEKAKKFNKQYKTTPFWIKFFEEIENNSLKNNSSYFKINNKDEYIKNLVDMIQRDADLYERSQKSKEVKQATENEIKKFIEENNNINANENSSKNNSSNISTETGKKSIKSNNVSSNNIKNNSRVATSKKSDLERNNKVADKNSNTNEVEKKNDINNKFNQILENYNKLDEKEKKLYLNEDDYETFKFKLITGGKFNSDKEKEIEKIPKTIKKLEKLEDISEKPMSEKEKQKDEILKFKGLKEFKTIDTLYFGDNYTFEELNYDKIDFFAYNKESLPKLLELDRRLHEIDPERYNTSINTELKKIQDEFNLGKEERMKKADKEIRDKFNKYIKEKDTKKTIFDVKPNDETKIKYKDYLHYNDEIKKERKELKMKLNELDDKIKQIYSNKELSKEKMDKINKEIEDYHSTEEYKQKYETLNVPGLIFLNRIKKEIINFENTNRELKQGLLEAKNLLEIEQKKSSKEEIEKYLKEIVEPFYEHEKEVQKFEEENKNDYDKVLKLENSIKKEEELLNNIQNSLNNLNDNKNKYDEMFEEADKIIMENNKDKNKIEGEENEKNIEKEEKYDPDKIMKKYGVEQIIEEQKENEKLIDDFNSQMKFFEEKIKNIKNLNDEAGIEIEDKKIISPEEFCQIPDEVKEYLKEKEREELELKNKNINEHNEIKKEDKANNNLLNEIKEVKEEEDDIKVKESFNDEKKEIEIDKIEVDEINNDSLENEEEKVKEKNENKNEEIFDSLEINKKENENK